MRRERAAGFTLIELMVVLAIIMLAAGLMTPTLSDFFSNRRLDALRGEFGTVFNRARLRAVTRGRDISVVFFQEGPRIYDELSGQFVDEGWDPNGSQLAGETGDVWYVLGFAGNAISYDDRYWRKDEDFRPEPPYIPPVSWWEERARRVGDGAGRRPTRSGEKPVGPVRYRVDDLYKVTFKRDGTLVFGPGATDVPTSVYNAAGTDAKDPGRADIMIFQMGNTSACYLDLRPTGQFRSKIIPLPEPAVRPIGGLEAK